MADVGKTSEPAIVFGLIDRILALLHESGATAEQSIAALQATEAIIPVADFQSRQHVTFHSR
jgi:hypothetical protein